jgi:hypothetical protein
VTWGPDDGSPVTFSADPTAEIGESDAPAVVDGFIDGCARP